MISSQTVRAAMMQVRAESRINFLTPSFLAIISGPLVLIFIISIVMGDMSYDGIFESAGAYSLAGLIGVAGTMSAFQVMSEMQQERTEGTLLRLRMLPAGATSWVVGKTITSFAYLLVTGALSITGSMIFFPDLRPESPVGYLALVLLLLASFLAFFPFGIMAGTLVRNTWGMLIAMVVFMVVYAGAGTMIPMDWYPDWVQWLVAATPFYWVAHLGRWALLPAEAGVAEITGSFEPLLGVVILGIWAIIGYAAAPKLLRSSLNRETVGGFQATREKIATRGYA
ncbi:MAG: ABC transporter permease [Ancrocorticia sp.]